MRQISINRRSNRILYDVTVSVDAAVFQEWLGFMRTDHIPKTFSTGCFSGHNVCTMLDESRDNYTVAMQYFADTVEQFEQYQKQFAAPLQKEYIQKFGQSAPAFRTVLHALEEGEVVSDIEASKN